MDVQCSYLVLACRASIDRTAVHHIRQTGKTVSNQSATPLQTLDYVAAKLQQLTASVHHNAGVNDHTPNAASRPPDTTELMLSPPSLVVVMLLLPLLLHSTRIFSAAGPRLGK